MKRSILWLVLVICTSFGFVACDDGDDAGDVTGTGGNDGTGTGDNEGTGTGEDEGTGEEVNEACATLQEGLNEDFDVDGTPRDFILHLPADVDSGDEWPVVFSWHGMGDTAQNFAGLFSGLVNNADFPFILVTPEDTNVNLMGAMTIDWDIAAVPDAETNIEARLVDEVLACIDSRWGVNDDHVHAAGFSMGSFATDLLGSIRSDIFASIATYSGGYGNNPANNSVMGAMATVINWPEFNNDNAYAQLMTHGGDADVFDAMVVQVNFKQLAENDRDFLNSEGHDVVFCTHSSGHTNGGISSAGIIKFFANHPYGQADSPFSAGMDAEFDACTFEAKD